MGTLLDKRDLRGDICLKHCKGGEYILLQRISYEGDPHWLYARYTHNDVVDFQLSLDGRLTSIHFDFFIINHFIKVSAKVLTFYAFPNILSKK